MLLSDTRFHNRLESSWYGLGTKWLLWRAVFFFLSFHLHNNIMIILWYYYYTHTHTHKPIWQKSYWRSLEDSLIRLIRCLYFGLWNVNVYVLCLFQILIILYWSDGIWNTLNLIQVITKYQCYRVHTWYFSVIYI